MDKVQVIIQAGDGGNGVVSFRHEKFVDRGGPDGGDGGKGGDIVLIASSNQDTLSRFRHQPRLVATVGTDGSKRRRHGKDGDNLNVKVPIGTIISDKEGTIIADLTQDNEQVVIARGGKGGFGNAHFTSSVRQAPRIAEKGEKGESLEATLELKMIADVGLVGLPNAGKSTLLSIISNAHPAVADYPFTTLTPNLGVVDVDDAGSLLVADIPGLIEGASEGKGLGDEFLRHVERTAVLIHLIDIYNADASAAYKTIQTELKAYKVNLAKLPQLVVLTKIDGLDQKQVSTKLKQLKTSLPKSTKLLAISAKTGDGVQELLHTTLQLSKRVRKAKKAASHKSLPVIRLADEEGWKVEVTRQGYVVTGLKIERFAMRTDFANPAGLERLRIIMKKMGIMHELERKGIKPGQKIQIGPSQGQKIEF